MRTLIKKLQALLYEPLGAMRNEFPLWNLSKNMSIYSSDSLKPVAGYWQWWKLCFDCHWHNVILPFFSWVEHKSKVVCKFIPGWKMWFFVLEKVVKNWMNQNSGNKILNIFNSLCKPKKKFSKFAKCVSSPWVKKLYELWIILNLIRGEICVANVIPTWKGECPFYYLLS